MNVYDFDKTVFYPDSSMKFYLFCFKKYPLAILRSLPLSAIKGLLYAVKLIDAKELKEQLFSFLPRVPDIRKAAEDFWVENYSSIGEWYLNQKQDNDLIISASPEFLLVPVCSRLNVRFIGTRMDVSTGKIMGKNCHDSEKVRRLYEIYPEAHIDSFYSDSPSDTPLAALAKNAFTVRHHSIHKWNFI